MVEEKLAFLANYVYTEDKYFLKSCCIERSSLGEVNVGEAISLEPSVKMALWYPKFLPIKWENPRFQIFPFTCNLSFILVENLDSFYIYWKNSVAFENDKICDILYRTSISKWFEIKTWNFEWWWNKFY